MHTRLLTAAALSALMLGAAACSDGTTDDVVRAPADGSAAQPVSETTADTAATQAAVALGMTRDQLEDADLFSTDLTDLGDVERLIIDAQSRVTHLVIELEGPGDREVMVPIDQVRSYRDARGDVDLQTDLTAAQLAEMPAWTGTAPAGSSVITETTPRATPPAA